MKLRFRPDVAHQFYLKMKSKIIKISFIAIIITVSCIILSFVFFGGCENDFKIYPEKGYCEFSLKSCEGIFGCKKFDDVQVPCENVSTLCGKKVLCNCGNINNR